MNTTKLSLIGFNILMLVILLFGCTLPFERPNPNLEVIISKEESLDTWALSPHGDKIVYWVSSSSKPLLFTPATQQRQELNISYCDYFGWLDNTMLWCINESNQSLVMTTDDFITIPLQRVDEQKVDLATLLKGKKIYQITYKFREKRFVLAMDANDILHPDKNYYVIAKDTSTILPEGYPVIILPDTISIQTGEKIYSLNGNFYYTYVIQDVPRPEPTKLIEIHRKVDNEKLAEFGTRDPNFLRVGGWAADNSGIYFSFEPGGMYGDPGKILYKLNVPAE